MTMQELRSYLRTTLEEWIEIVIDEIEADSGVYSDVQLFIEEISCEGIRFSTDIEFTQNETLRFKLPAIGLDDFLIGQVVCKKQNNNDCFQYGMVING